MAAIDHVHLRKQRKLVSWIEAGGLVAVGFVINVAVNYYALPLFGFEPSISDSVGLTVLFTAVAIPRNYLWRRLFEWLRVSERIPPES